MASKKYPFAEQFGREVGLTERAYSKLAELACKYAAEGEIGPEDAGPLLENFKDSRNRSAGKGRLVDPPGPQQISKLKKIIEVGSFFKQRGVEMLRKTQKLHMKELQNLPQDKLNYEGEYNLLVQVARDSLKKSKPLDKNEILSIAKKN
jgi:hypothetical protein